MLTRQMKIAVIGGGINGIMAAWALVRRGCAVDLFEKNRLMSATSRASTKMLHGGIRYLEYGHFRLVREALQERAWWLRQAPDLARPVEILLPHYAGQGRPGWVVGAGVRLYDGLALGSGFPRGRRYAAAEVVRLFPTLKTKGLDGAHAYWDGQMDDYRLGLWAAGQAVKAGVSVHEGATVTRIDSGSGGVSVDGETRVYDRVINAAGPWSKALVVASGLESRYGLDLIRGSHLVLAGRIQTGCVLQVPGEKRILFVLPHGESTLLGTTEVKQETPEPAMTSRAEIDYLLSTYNRFFDDGRTASDVVASFAGVRPIVTRTGDFSAASRESAIERQGRLVNVFGGKWTTSRALANSIAKMALEDG